MQTIHNRASSHVPLAYDSIAPSPSCTSSRKRSKLHGNPFSSKCNITRGGTWPPYSRRRSAPGTSILNRPSTASHETAEFSGFLRNNVQWKSLARRERDHPVSEGISFLFFFKKKKKRDKIEDTQDSRNREGNKKEFVGAKRTYNTGYSLVVTDPTTNPALTGLSRGERTGSRVLQWIWSYVLDAGTALCFVPHNRGRAKSC